MTNHFQEKVVVLDDYDKQAWEIISNVPHVTKPIAFVAAFFNIIIPGIGTVIAACGAENNVSKTQLAIGLC